MKLFDGNNLVEIKIRKWTGSGYSQDYAEDFFEAGGLAYDDEMDAYRVNDVDYCIDQADDFVKGVGDYATDEPDPDMTLDVDYL